MLDAHTVHVPAQVIAGASAPIVGIVVVVLPLSRLIRRTDS